MFIGEELQIVIPADDFTNDTVGVEIKLPPGGDEFISYSIDYKLLSIVFDIKPVDLGHLGNYRIRMELTDTIAPHEIGLSSLKKTESFIVTVKTDQVLFDASQLLEKKEYQIEEFGAKLKKFSVEGDIKIVYDQPVKKTNQYLGWGTDGLYDRIWVEVIPGEG